MVAEQTSSGDPAAAADPRGSGASRSDGDGDGDGDGGDVVAIRLREPAELFNPFDPAPVERKELRGEVDAYIVDRAREVPAGAPAALVVYLERAPCPPEMGRAVGAAVRGHFARRRKAVRRDFRRLLRDGAISLVIGLIFLTASLVGGEAIARLMGQGPWATVLRESLLIGGWVALSTPAQILLFDWWALRDTRRFYGRLSRMPVRTVCAGGRGVDGERGRTSHGVGLVPQQDGCGDAIRPGA